MRDGDSWFHEMARSGKGRKLPPDPPHAPCLGCGKKIIRRRGRAARPEGLSEFQERKFCNDGCRGMYELRQRLLTERSRKRQNKANS